MQQAAEAKSFLQPRDVASDKSTCTKQNLSTRKRKQLFGTLEVALSGRRNRGVVGGMTEDSQLKLSFQLEDLVQACLVLHIETLI